MTDASAPPPPSRRAHPGWRWLSDTLDSAAMARAFTLTTFGAVFSSIAILRTAGQVAYVTIIVGLCLCGAAILVRRRRELNLLRLLPSTLVLFLVWLLLTVFWSTDELRTLVSWVALAGLTFLAIVIAHVRDTLQTARALGDVLRSLLLVSLGLEVLSGILLDAPIAFLGIQGNLASAGPIQGIFGTRNMLGFVTVIALITFVIEWRTNAIRPGVGLFSIILAGSMALLSSAPTVLVLALAVGAATGALALVRHTAPSGRFALQITLASVVTVGLAIAYAFRHPIIGLLNAGSDFATRATLWDTLLVYIRARPVQGWGWFGPWPRSEFPFNIINIRLDDTHASALNAYFDVLVQAGWVGLLLFVGMCALAVVRSWLVASARRSVVYAWTPLILVTLLVSSMFESFTLMGAGWLMLVVCVVRAGLTRSWRERIDKSADPEQPLTPAPPALS